MFRRHGAPPGVHECDARASTLTARIRRSGAHATKPRRVEPSTRVEARTRAPVWRTLVAQCPRTVPSRTTRERARSATRRSSVS
ncbi:hypothetical protein DB32_002331 [Sandaracinus amylolyticus]|uniref:Uncharacterized protein n=1 Tax=Sandaracinus amylolyticus TaxID=927083 RepID=A0A0F6YHV8_9BACT|nr:hypothetical protein DB32_002331 [Sandaracinus amylolyticus]